MRRPKKSGKKKEEKYYYKVKIEAELIIKDISAKDAEKLAIETIEEYTSWIDSELEQIINTRCVTSHKLTDTEEGELYEEEDEEEDEDEEEEDEDEDYDEEDEEEEDYYDDDGDKEFKSCPNCRFLPSELKIGESFFCRGANLKTSYEDHSVSNCGYWEAKPTIEEIIKEKVKANVEAKPKKKKIK